MKLSDDTITMLHENKIPKGDPLPLARVAAIMAAKNTSSLIPYCHPLLIDATTVDFEFKPGAIDVTVTVTAVAKTGVEMEALTAASIAALTLYDMLKPVDASLEILSCRLLKKTGGKSSYPTRAPEGLSAAVVVVSDSIASETRSDESGKIVAEILAEWQVNDINTFIVPDERDQITAVLRDLVQGGTGLVLTTGGTGLGPRDVTCEATEDIIDREAPGISEAMRAYGQKRTPYSMLSHGVSGIAGQTLIVNLPGSPSGVRDCMAAIFPAIFHVFPILDGKGH